MKYLLQCTLAMLLATGLEASNSTWISNADDITEAWLIEAGNQTGYTDHISHFKEVFNTMKINTFLEFGVGFSTKYFIDHCEKVISTEFVTPGTGPEWMKYCIDLYSDYASWTPIVYFSGSGLDTSWAPNKYMGVPSVYAAAAFQPVYLLSYAMLDTSFLVDLRKFVDQQVAKNPIDLAFVDPGVCIRGDLVQVLFNRVPIIVAHDVVPKEKRLLNDVYGYGRISVPDNYEEVYIPMGLGTAFWIKKEVQYQPLKEALIEYVRINQKE